MRDRREFDLYDPDSKKKDLPARVSDEDPRLTISGMVGWLNGCAQNFPFQSCITSIYSLTRVIVVVS